MSTTQLEQAITERARTHLGGVRAFYAKAKAGTAREDDRRDYQRAHAAMSGLLELGHWRDSGMSEAGRAALLTVEVDAVEALRDYCTAATAIVAGHRESAKIAARAQLP